MLLVGLLLTKLKTKVKPSESCHGSLQHFLWFYHLFDMIILLHKRQAKFRILKLCPSIIIANW